MFSSWQGKLQPAPDVGGGAVIVTIQYDDNVPRTQLDGYNVQEHPPTGVCYFNDEDMNKLELRCAKLRIS